MSPRLTPLESRVVGYIALGLTDPQIGTELGFSPRTIQDYLDRIVGKLPDNPGGRRQRILRWLAQQESARCG